MTTHTPSRQTTCDVRNALLSDWYSVLKGWKRCDWDWNEPRDNRAARLGLRVRRWIHHWVRRMPIGKDDPGVGLSNRAMTTLAIVGWVAFIGWGLGVWG